MPSLGLNDSGEMLLTCIVGGAALHVGRGEQTLEHAQYAWKIHVGIDAPVWLESEKLTLTAVERAQVVVVPPGYTHRVGAVGLSYTVLIAPGTRGAAFRGCVPMVYGGKRARLVIELCRALPLEQRRDVSDFVSALVPLGLGSQYGAPKVDVRVRKALVQLACDPSYPLHELASRLDVSLDRLSHLTADNTGLPLRRHALWSRLLRLLSSNQHYSSIAAAAQAAGFADHAHMTRTYRAMVGRLPSEFSAPPDTVEPWATWQ